MSDSIISVFTGTISEETIHLANARDLHEFLEVGKDFTTWIKDRVKEYDFIENQDFICIEDLSSPKSGSSKARPQKLTEYHITLDMAKELAMVERNEKGKQARLYFIECEKALKEPKEPVISTLIPASKELKAALATAKLFGFKGNQALLSANRAVTHITGVNLMTLLDVRLESPSKEKLFTPSEIALVLGLGSGQKVNKLLEVLGYQNKVAGQWQPVPEAFKLGEMLDTGKARFDGVPIKQWKWYTGIMDILRHQQDLNEGE